MSDPRARAEDLVHAFGQAWEARDIDAITGFLHQDVAYQNVPAPILHGRDRVRAFITPSLKAVERMVWEFKATTASADGAKVLTERVDTFVFAEGAVVVPLMGIFEIAGDLIVRWRDYCDLGAFARATQAIGRTVSPALEGSQ